MDERTRGTARRAPWGGNQSGTAINEGMESPRRSAPPPFRQGGQGEITEAAPEPVGREQLIKWTATLKKYKAGKASIESRAKAAENWWKLHNEIEEDKTTNQNPQDFKCKSGWLHNVIVSKHADAMEAFPTANVLPREAGDRKEAAMLSSVIPALLEQGKFKRVYDRNMWQKLKTGTAIYRVSWDSTLLNGLGDLRIERMNLLNIFWEPGVDDIQESKYVFCTYLDDRDELQSRYPQLRDGRLGSDFTATKWLYDDAVDTSDKATVIEVYYHRWHGEKKVLHYCKYVGNVVLYSTENNDARADAEEAAEAERIAAGYAAAGNPGGGLPPHQSAAPTASPQGEAHRSRGLYEHGKFPFVFDPLFPVEGSPCGYGFVDLASNPQTQIDIMKSAFLKNTVTGATPRYFARGDGSINEEEFLDLRRPVVHVTGNVGEDSLRPMVFNSLPAAYIKVLESTIHELRQVTGNTETATGSTTAGATAASAIAALQEASGKGSRDSTQGSYQAFADVVELVIELIRQFMNAPRVFRITGANGEEQFVSYSNAGLAPQPQGGVGGQDLGCRVPAFDLKIEPQKRSAYTQMSQNEMALQFYGAGFFDPGKAEQALATIEMMEFEGKEEIVRKISANADMFEKLLTFQKLALALTAKYEPERLGELSQAITGQAAPMQASGASIPEADFDPEEEPTHVKRARERAASASQPA